MRQGLPGERQRVSTAPFGDRAKTRHPRTKYARQKIKTRPRQEELAGPRRQGPGKRSLPGRPSRSIKTRARGACREGRSRLKVTSLRETLARGACQED